MIGADPLRAPDEDCIHIDVAPVPRLVMTIAQDMDEENAALYLSYRMRRRITASTLRRWRLESRGPSYSSSPSGRIVWYRLWSLDRWCESQNHSAAA